MLYVILLCSVLLCGCNTIKGVGQDVEKTGEALQESAQKNKNY